MEVRARELETSRSEMALGRLMRRVTQNLQVGAARARVAKGWRSGGVASGLTVHGSGEAGWPGGGVAGWQGGGVAGWRGLDQCVA